MIITSQQFRVRQTSELRQTDQLIYDGLTAGLRGSPSFRGGYTMSLYLGHPCGSLGIVFFPRVVQVWKLQLPLGTRALLMTGVQEVLHPSGLQTNNITRFNHGPCECYITSTGHSLTGVCYLSAVAYNYAHF